MDSYTTQANINGTNRFVEQQQAGQKVNLLELGFVLLRKWLILLLALVLGEAASAAYTTFLVTPVYESSSMIYIYNKTTSVTSLTDLQIGTQLTVDFQIVATTREVLEATIADLNLNTTYEQLNEHVSITNPDNSRILKITVQDSNPQMAADIANALADELRERIAEVMNTDEPSMLTEAVPSAKWVSPSLVKNTVFGGLAALLLAATIIMIRFMMDDTIKSEDDIEKYLGLNTLAVISVDPDLKSDRDRHERRSGDKRDRPLPQTHTSR